MKHRSFKRWNLGVLPTILLLAGTALRTTAEPESPSPEVLAGSAIVAPGEPSDADVPAADTDAPATLVSPEKPLPSTIRPSGPVAEVIKLANSGLDESVMLAFVTNSTRTFNLGAEEIIYLNDIGVPGPVVTAMIQRDEALKTMMAAGVQPPAPPPVEEPQAANPSEVEPAPESVAPQPMENGPGYAEEAPLTPPDDGTDEMFYDSLAPYGNWVDVAGYGRCWQPTAVVVNAGWQPYFDCGRWVYSDCGWYWHSDYSWGWGPFHYGSWFRHARMGWCWVPGRVWGPSWVSWRYNGRYCGWAPLPPGASFAVGIGLNFHGHHVRDGDDCGLRPGHYRFVAWDHFNDHHLKGAAAPWSERHRIYETTTVATRITGDNQTVINNGLPVSRVAAATHRPIHTVALRHTTEPVPRGGRLETSDRGGHALAVYRPDPQRVARPGRGLNGMQSRGNTLSAQPTYSNPTPWSSYQSTHGSATHQRPAVPQGGKGTPLVIRGAQPAAARESAPPNSLVVIGRGTGNSPWRPAAAPETPAAMGERGLRAEQTSRPMPSNENAERNWRGERGTVSPQPSWFGNARGAQNHANSAPRPESYQPVPRATAPQVQRYAPAPSYAPAPRSYSAPSYSAPARSAPAREPSFSSRPAPSAPSAPAARGGGGGGGGSQPSGHNGRR